MKNLILNVDSYKTSHFNQRPPGTDGLAAYVEARGSKIEGVTEVVHFGLQAFIREHLWTPITLDDVNEAEEFCKAHGVPFDRAGWIRVVEKHGGYLPIVIRSVPEGTPVPIGNQVVRVESIDPELPWLATYVETALLRAVWYGSTVATISREIKKIISYYLEETSDDPAAELPFKLHDFGGRGVSSEESAGVGGAAHLVNFLGTDTISGILYAQEHYDAGVCGFSIAASEHSTMTAWGQDREQDAYLRMVMNYAREGAIFACVIDSYNWMEAVEMWTRKDFHDMSLLDMVEKAGATVVLRPDSGDPIRTPCELIELLMSRVGYEVNSKGFKVLPKHVRVIQGDGIDIHDIKKILSYLKYVGISASNIAFGMGGGLLQKVNRDTFKFAMKACAVSINGKWHDVFKAPMGQADKASKRGLLQTYRHEDGRWMTLRESDKVPDGFVPALETVHRRGFGTARAKFLTFDEVRANAALKGTS